MSLLRVGKNAEARLLEAPESGMGFQLIRRRYEDELLLIFNATVAIAYNEFRERRFSKEEYYLLSGDPDGEWITELGLLEIEYRFSIVFSNLDPNYQDRSLGLSFNETAISPPPFVISPKRPYSYYRFSPYFRDKRVDGYGNFLPGTYATTYNDLHFVPSGFAAVGRYALPNPASARYVFQIVTFCPPDLIGTATPNFGQAGGGVEVLFKAGARNRPDHSFMINAG